MIILDKKSTKENLLQNTDVMFEGGMVKAVVDVECEVIAVDAELHADLEQLLLDNGSRQEHLWGINLYPEEEGEDLIEYDSLINIRPRQNNRSRDVEDMKIRESIVKVVHKWIE